MNNISFSQKIQPDSLIAMDSYVDSYPLRIDMAYARADNLLFGEQIYRHDARLWLHKDLAAVTLRAAQICHERHGLYLVLHDGLRTTDAQVKMLRTQRVKAHPEWLAEPRLLSPPGRGAHPRGMAIDLSVQTQDGIIVDMGTPFDYLCEHGSGPDMNAAHREFSGLSKEFAKNRNILTSCMVDAAQALNIPLVPLPQEWWDFRLPADIYNTYAPLSDNDLPPDMRMT